MKKTKALSQEVMQSGKSCPHLGPFPNTFPDFYFYRRQPQAKMRPCNYFQQVSELKGNQQTNIVNKKHVLGVENEEYHQWRQWEVFLHKIYHGPITVVPIGFEKHVDWGFDFSLFCHRIRALDQGFDFLNWVPNPLDDASIYNSRGNNFRKITKDTCFLFLRGFKIPSRLQNFQILWGTL